MRNWPLSGPLWIPVIVRSEDKNLLWKIDDMVAITEVVLLCRARTIRVACICGPSNRKCRGDPLTCKAPCVSRRY